MKIYDGESARPIDIQSMVVKTNQGSWMKIYDGESEMPIDENLGWWYGGESEMPIDAHLWWWDNWNAHGCLIHGGEITEMPMDV